VNHAAASGSIPERVLSGLSGAGHHFLGWTRGKILL